MRVAAWLIGPLMLAAMIGLHGFGKESYLMGDFRAFYCAGEVAAHGANPYLEEPLRTCESRTGPPPEPTFLREVALPAPLPPYALLPFIPLSRLPFPLASALYCALSLLAMGAAIVAFARLSGASTLMLILVFAAISGTVTLFIGQPVPFALCALAFAALHLRKGRWTAAGACAVAATIEPHLALPAILGMLIAVPQVRASVIGFGLALGLTGIIGLGLPISIEYLREVAPAHALANAYEWQFSLTSVLTSLGVGGELAVRLGEIMFAAMTAFGIFVAYRLMRLNGDRAAMILIPPAFAVFGGVHVHFQQIVVAFPAILYVAVRYPHVRMLTYGGLCLVMIPWNVVTPSLLAGTAPILVGAFCAITIGRRAGLWFALAGACIILSVFAMAYIGFGPAEPHLVVRSYPADALAEVSWGDFSRVVLSRASLLTQWLRIPIFAGLACGLAGITWVACLDRLRFSLRSHASLAGAPS